MEPEGWGVPLRLTWRNCRIPPLIRNESAAMPAIPSPGSRSCRREAALGAVAVCNGQQHPEQQHADASGCELCRIMRALGDVVTRTGGGGAWQGQQWWPLFTLSLEHTGDTLIIDLRSINIVDRCNMTWVEMKFMTISYSNFSSKCRSFLKFLHFISHPILFNYVTL